MELSEKDTDAIGRILDTWRSGENDIVAKVQNLMIYNISKDLGKFFRIKDPNFDIDHFFLVSGSLNLVGMCK